MKNKRMLLCLCLCGLALLASACSAPEDIDLYNGEDAQEVTLGVAYPAEALKGDTLFEMGLEMAVSDVNAAGGILGKPLSLLIRDDQGDTTLATQIAQSFIDQGITAVIGHWGTNVAYIVEDIYEQAGVVMITPSATGEDIFEYRYNHIFRMISTNEEYAGAIARYMKAKGMDNIAIYHSDDVYGVGFASTLESALSRNGITVIDRLSSLSSINVQRVRDRWRAFGCRGVIVAAVMPEAAQAVRYVRQMDLALPIFGAENFDRQSFLPSVGNNPENLYTTRYDESALDPDFRDRFVETYGKMPDVFAINAYECVMILADAMNETQSLQGADVAGFLKQVSKYRTISTVITYNEETQEFDGQPLVVAPLRQQ